MTDIVHVDDAWARIVETIKPQPIVLFMKGSPSRPQCGFSAAVIQTIAHYGTPYRTVDVLADPPVRQAIKTFSDWPTIPQLYVGGALHRRTATRWAQARAPSEAIFGGGRSSDPAQSGRVTLHQATRVPK
jgi:monothiol glutaredoxin